MLPVKWLSLTMMTMVRCVRVAVIDHIGTVIGVVMINLAIIIIFIAVVIIMMMMTCMVGS